MKVVVIIRSIELFDYIDEYNNNIVTKVYRLEISNIPYSIKKTQVQYIYNLIWYIKHRFNITNYNGDMVRNMLNNDISDIEYDPNDITIMPANNFIEFEMSLNEYKTLTKRYHDVMKDIAQLTVNDYGFTTSRVGVKSLIMDYCICGKEIHNDYEFYIVIGKAQNYRLIVGYLYSELGIDDYTLIFNIGNRFTITYDTDESNAAQYYSHVKSLENKRKIAEALDEALRSISAETTFTFDDDEEDITERLVSSSDSIPLDYQRLSNPGIIFTDSTHAVLPVDSIVAHPP